MPKLISKIVSNGILMVLCSLWGCGLRGDLYLPEEKAANSNAPASTEALQTSPGEEDVQGFIREDNEEDEKEDDDEDKVTDEQSYPDTGMPLEP